MELLIQALRSKLTTFFGAIPGAVVALTQILNLADNDPTTLFDWKVFVMAVAMFVGFFVSKDVIVSGGVK